MLIIAVFAVTPIFSFYAFAEESAKEIKLIYTKIKTTKIDRSPDFADVEAWYDSGSMTVTVEGCELKDTFIYIMSQDGLVLAQTSHYSVSLPRPVPLTSRPSPESTGSSSTPPPSTPKVHSSSTDILQPFNPLNLPL